MRTNTGRAIAGGFAGTLVMTGMMYMVAPMMGVHMDIAVMLGSMLGGSWAAGLAMHFVNGSLIFPLVFVSVLLGRLPGPAPVRGVLFGVGLWLVAQVMVMPMMGAGLFSVHAGGAMAAMGSLVGHALYGAVLGAAVASPAPAVARA
jgi:Family of unknown function (DUF6789)